MPRVSFNVPRVMYCLGRPWAFTSAWKNKRAMSRPSTALLGFCMAKLYQKSSKIVQDGELLSVCRFTEKPIVPPHFSGLPTYQELRRGWVNTAALLGSGSLIRYESVPEGLRPLGGEVARVSAWSRGVRPLSEWRAAQRR